MTVRELTPAECPQLGAAPELVEQYNGLAAELLALRAADPAFYERKDCQSLVAEVRAVGEVMARPRYDVGLIGLLPIDRSRMLNRLRRASENDHPTFASRNGDATTGPRVRAMPPEVERVDLPGLATGWVIETVLTDGLVEALDGALVFYHVTSNLANEGLGDVLVRLRGRFGRDLRGRVWLVFTDCDALTRSRVEGPEGNIFAGIQTFLDRAGLAAEQVVFTCDEWDGKTTEQIADQLRERAGTADLAARFGEQHPALVEAFGALLHNGGLDRLRRLITAELKGEVEREARAELPRRLELLSEDLAGAVQTRARERVFDADRHRELRQVVSRLVRARGIVENDPRVLAPGEAFADLFAGTARRLCEELLARFDEVCPDEPWVRTQGPGEVADRFPGDARLLEERLHELLTRDLIREAYARVGELLADLPEAAVVSCPHGSRRKWNELAAADGRDRDWRARFRVPTFLSEALFLPGAAGAGSRLDGPSYREMMREKVRVVTHQAVHALRLRAREHLARLQAAYDEAIKAMGP